MDSISFVNQLLALLSILGQIFILLVVFYFLFSLKKQNFLFKKINNLKLFKSTVSFLGERGLVLAFIVALTSTLGSLFYSEFLGYTPCSLCWYQRIFIYPQVIILGLAILKKDLAVIKYSISLSLVGILIALYQYFIQLRIFSGLPCPAIGSSCDKLFIIEFGYVTIPLMSLTAFAIVPLPYAIPS